MSEMVERVARALCPEQDGPGRLTGDDGRFYPSGVPRWHQWVDDARAALAAMREPTEAMVREGGWAEDADGRWVGEGVSRECWGKMINRAIED